MKKKLSLLLAIMFSFGSVMPVGATEYKDVAGNWAETTINEWSGYGVVSGYEDGTFKPSNNITRAELASLIDRVMKYEVVGENNFSDLNGDEWYATSILKNLSAGNINGYQGNTINANSKVTRQEVAFTICNAFDIEPINGETIFADDSSISDWAKGSVNALAKAGYLTGRANNVFAPQELITRAEVLTILDNVVSDFYSNQGTYTTNSTSNVLINTEDVVLNDTIVNGNLYVTAGVGNGDLTLENVIVTGAVIVEGGGEHSVKFTNNSKANLVKVQKNANQAVRIFVDETSSIGNTSVSGNADVKVEGSGDFGTLTLEGTNTVEVAINTTISDVEINGGGIFINNGVINKITISEDAFATQISGSGSAETILVNNYNAFIDLAVNNLTVLNENSNIQISDKVKAVVDSNGKDAKDMVTLVDKDGNVVTESSNNSNSSNSGGSSSGGGGGNTNTQDKTAPVLSSFIVTEATSNSATVGFNSTEAGTFVTSEEDVANLGTSKATTMVKGLNYVTFTDLTPNTSYTYKFIARDSSGNTSTTYTFEFKTPEPDTTAPVLSNFTFEDVTANSVKVCFDSNEKGRFVTSKEDRDKLGTIAASPMYLGRNTATFSNLTVNTSYTQEFIACDASGNISEVYTITFKTAETETPPTLLDYKFESITYNSATLIFSTSEAGTYELKVDDTTTLTGAMIPGFNEVPITNLTANTAYTFVLTLTDEAGLSSSHDVKVATLQDPSVVTNAPYIYKAGFEGVTSDSAIIVFSSDVAGTYNILDSATSGSLKTGNAVIGENRVTLSGLTSYTEYDVTLNVRNSDNKNSHLFMSFATIPPTSTDLNIVSLKVADITSNSAEISVTGNVTLPRSYTVGYVSSTGDVVAGGNVNISDVAETISLTNLQPSTKYYISIAHNVDGVLYVSTLHFTTASIS